MGSNYILLFIVLILFCAAGVNAEQIIWLDGSKDPNGPPGKLLTDNPGYWGECVLTGVNYTYETVPDNPADIFKEDASKFGNRLLDGYHSDNWWTTVGISGKPLVTVFDFKRRCVFKEVDIITRSKQAYIKVELSVDNQDWKTVAEMPKQEAADSTLQRVKIPAKQSGRYMRLTVDAGSVTYLDEVMAWGDADASDATPEYLKPIASPTVANMVALETIPGKQATACSDSSFFTWFSSLGNLGKASALWSNMNTWGELTSEPILPKASKIGKPVEIVMARNEGECAAVVLTNTSINAPFKTKVALSKLADKKNKSAAKDITAELMVAGTIPSRWYGVNVGPLFTRDNMIGKSLMQRYLTNGAAIMNFPSVTLPAAGSLVFWIKVQSKMAKPGIYEAKLSYDGGKPVTVRVKVLDVKLPDVRAWLQSWSSTTSQFPFMYSDRTTREVDYKTSLGINVWNGFPEKDSLSEAASKKCKAIYHIWGIGKYGHSIYGGGFRANQITPEVEKEVADIINGHVKQAEELGLKYDDWYIELTDEPGKGNAEVFGAFCKLVKKINPKVRIFCNPSFWIGFENGGVSPDKEVYDAMSSWYNDCIDVSCPIYLHLDNRPLSAKLFNHKRAFNTFYYVCSQSAKSEKDDAVNNYRKFAWTAMSLGWNGWGFYSYFAPRGNAWDDFDASFYFFEDLPDYQVVYPGPRGPVATRQSESFREGWEDYRLLYLLKQKKPAVFESIMNDFKSGMSVVKLRNKALQALTSK